MTRDRAGVVPFSTALAVWVRIALNSFGGPAGQIAVMHRILVEEKRWIGEERFLHALNFCMLLPGPEAQQLAIYIGWLLHGYPGGLVAGSLFVLPGFLAILVLSFIYAAYQKAALVAALFFGLKAAVLAVVVEAVVRIGRRVLKNAAMLTIAVLAFIGIFVFKVPFPLIVLGAGVVGLLGGHFLPGTFVGMPPRAPGRAGETGTVVDALLDDQGPVQTRPSMMRSVRIAGLLLLLWLGPVALLAAFLGPENVFVKVGIFFSKAATVTFGGAYSVLAYVAQQAVDHYGWLRPGEMLDGLGMAETTPGPLIQVVQFVGFMGCYRAPGHLHPMVAGTLGAILTTWVTFVPCFLWIFLGAPYVETLRGHRRLGAALAAITAAVVGVMLNLALWFSMHVVWSERGTLDLPALLIALGALVAIFRYRAGMLPTLGASAVLGAVFRTIAGP